VNHGLSRNCNPVLLWITLEAETSFVLNTIVCQLADEKVNKVREARRLAYNAMTFCFRDMKQRSGMT
jgi:hypothetical protein